MSAALVVVVVGACIAIVASVMSSALEPVTKTPSHARAGQRKRRPPEPARPRARPRPRFVEPEPAPRVAVGEPVTPLRWRDRLRAAALLGLLATTLGVAVATAFGLTLFVLVSLLRRSLG